ncbi:unnamed protein product [Fusarium equiseti]|uniref:Uncharacterized protein n=1 Tax=Fusarium equiseti TaxID=61235 RepID=A0A8J2IXM2_FUSEQ|nr:unnamed protein product [Fusarium equiseti]
MHAKICEQVRSYQQEVVTLPLGPYENYPGRFRDQRFRILQPLFKGLTIIVSEDDFYPWTTDLGKLPVLLSLTGAEEGLSQALTFNSIRHQVTKFISETTVQVPFGVAMDFVEEQNKREVAAFGVQPDPVESTTVPHYLDSSGTYTVEEHLKVMGGGDEPILGPSSAWVDTEVQIEWPAESAYTDKHYFGKIEKSCRWNMLRRLAGIDDFHPRVPTCRHSI